MSSIDEFIREDIFNLAINTGSKMTPRVDKTTLSNLISLFLGRLDAKAALNELIVYIARQTGRREIPRDIAKLLLSDIRQIRSKCRNEEELREAISKYLVLLRWVYDSDVRNVDNIDRFMSKLTE
ncbi:MAG: hypothetical protein QXK51_05965 [Candidatus Methanomethylicia archaeon]